MSKKENINLSMKKIASKYNEWKNDPIKWIEECVQLPSVGGYENITLYEPQKRVLRSFYKDHHLIILKSRQTGFSTLFQLIVAHVTLFYKNVKMGVLSRSGAEATDFNRKVMDIIANIKYSEIMFPGYRKETEQSFELKNGSGLTAQAISRSNPSGVFRGKSLSLLLLDEAAFIEYVDDVWTAVAPALSKAQQVAKNKNVPFGTIIISTPNKKSGIGRWFYLRWINTIARNEENVNSLWKAHRVHWKEVPDFADDPSWYNNQCEILEFNPNKIAQELELQFVGDEDALFSTETQNQLNEIKTPEDTKRIETFGGTINLFVDTINPKEFYIIGVDCASAAGKDFSTIEVFDYKNMVQIAEYRGKLEPLLFAKVVKLVDQMFPKNLIVVENSGGYGLTVLNDLQFDMEKTYNLFSKVKVNKSNNKMRSRTEVTYGLNNNVKTRPLILDAMFEFVTQNPFNIKSELLALELLSLTKNKQNKIEADTGFNDDLVFAYAFICYVRKYELEFVMSSMATANTFDDPMVVKEIPRVEEMINEMNEYDHTPNSRHSKLSSMYPEYDRYLKEIKNLYNPKRRNENSIVEEGDIDEEMSDLLSNNE